MKKFFDIIPPQKLETDKPSLKQFRRRLIKIICLSIIISLGWAGLLSIGETFANFSDIEISEGNIFSAGTLDFTLHSGQDNFVPESKSENLEPGDEVNRVIQVRNEGNLPFQYTAQTEKISGDDDFCNALQLKADLEGNEIYAGSLMDFTFSAIEISKSGIDTWHFKVSLPEDSNFQNKTCKINFVFESWQTNFSDPTSGFFDQEEIESYFASPTNNPNFTSGDSVIIEGATTDNSGQETPQETPSKETMEESATGETPVIEELVIDSTENDQSDSPINEETTSSPATIPEDTLSELPNENSSVTSPESAPETPSETTSENPAEAPTEASTETSVPASEI